LLLYKNSPQTLGYWAIAFYQIRALGCGFPIGTSSA